MNLKFQGQRLRFARMYNGLSVTDLANQVGLSKQLISQYENDETSPGHEKVLTMANALGFPYDFFMTEDICCMLRMLLRKEEPLIQEIAEDICCNFEKLLQEHRLTVIADRYHEKAAEK